MPKILKMLKGERHSLLVPFLFFLSLFLRVNGSHFVLVHGAGYGAWCWYKVATMLKSAGHNVTALDMAACGINPKQMEEIDSISEYHEPLMTFIHSLPPNHKVILVGHSLGGVSVSVAMEKFPDKISVAVFATASVVSENLTYSTLGEELMRRLGPDSEPYQLSPDEDLTLASYLKRPTFAKDPELVTKETAVTKSRNGRVSKIYIISGKDKVLTKDFQLWVIEKTGPYAEVKVIEDSDHMVMFSKPKKLSYELLEIADKYSLHSDI
ncbi:hypothetical protein VNO77_09170 [Canavalia gladiata]|uniref:AB hydrolase-1 domain-containing protein n=1 Tax=Canavalia gladiata TaxID=3824 RepID=A0AAN9QX98_CANGL